MKPNWVTQPMIKPQGRLIARRKSLGVSPAPSPNMMTNTRPPRSASSNGVTTVGSLTASAARITDSIMRYPLAWNLTPQVAGLSVHAAEFSRSGSSVAPPQT